MFYYNESSLSDMISSIDKNINQMRDMENGYLDKMEPISKSGLYGNGIEMVDSQIVSIKDGLTDFKNITNNNKEAVKETEIRLKQDVSKIELPINFDPNDVGIIFETSNVSLYKNNGKLINNDTSLDKKTMNDYENINIDVIKKFAKDALEKINFDEYLKTKEINIENIKNNTTNKVQINDYNETEKNDLTNINKKNELIDNKLDEYKETNKTYLTGIQNNILRRNELDEYKETQKINANFLGNNKELNDSLLNKENLSEDELLEDNTRGDNNDYKG